MIRRIGIVVPAADEQNTIGKCIAALLSATRRVDCEVRIVVVLDACTDDTANVVSCFPTVETLVTSARNVGAARRRGAEYLLRTDPGPAALLIASTDADSVVPREWLAVMLVQSADADLVLGAVVPDDGLARPVAQAWAARHMLVEGHPHVHAANLAVRAETYRAVGGWRELRTGEDHDLHARVIAAGGRVRRTAQAPVCTSTRPTGRAPRGFSSYLRALGHR